MSWYYLKEGSPKGPVSTAELIKEFECGSVSASDSLFKEGDIKWRTAKDFEELRPSVLGSQAVDSTRAQKAQSTKKTHHAPDAKWVVLVPKMGGAGFSQRGPFNDEQVKALLKANQVTLESFIWQKGFKEWRKIQSLEEFNSFSVKAVKPLPPLPDQAEELPRDLSAVTSKIELPEEITRSFNLKSEKTEVTSKKSLDIGVSEKAVAQAKDSNPQTPQGVKIHKPILPSESTEEVTAKKTFIKSAEASRGVQKPAVESDIATVIYKPPKKEKPKETPLPNVLQSQVASVPRSSSVDPDATVIRPRPCQNKTIQRPQKSADAGVQFVKRSSIAEYYLSLDPVRQGLFTASLVLTAVAFVMITAYVASYLDRKNAVVVEVNDLNPMDQFQAETAVPEGESQSSIDSQAKVEVSPAQVPKPRPVVAEPASTKAVAPTAMKMARNVKTEPTYLRVVVAQNGLDTASLNLETDASYHFPIQIWFRADGGRTLSTKSIYKYVNLKGQSDRSLSLRSWGLPFGYLDVEVKVGNIEKRERVQYGTRSEKFRTDLERTRKKLIHYQNEERYGYLKTVSRLESELKKLIFYLDKNPKGQGWGIFYKGWVRAYVRAATPKLASFTRRSRSSYIHPELWDDLKSANSKVLEVSRTIAQNQNGNNGEHAQTLKSIVSQMAKMKDQMLSGQLWD